MAKKSQTAIWKEAADRKIEAIREGLAQGKEVRAGRKGKLDSMEAAQLIVLGRRSQSVAGRWQALAATIKNRLADLLESLDLVELSSKRSFVRLDPKLEMGKNEKGKKAYAALVKKYGRGWTEAHVAIITTRTSRGEAEVQVTHPDINDGAVLHNHIWLPEALTEEYFFLSDSGATTKQLLEWTRAMGNRPEVNLGGIPERYKLGEPREPYKAKDIVALLVGSYGFYRCCGCGKVVEGDDVCIYDEDTQFPRFYCENCNPRE